MGILDSLKSMVGSGAPKVEVKLLKTQAAVQENVKGLATITGGEYAVVIDKLIFQMLMVEDLVETGKTKESTIKAGYMSMNEFSLEPKETIIVPFQIKIPKNNLISSSAIKHFVQVQMDIPGQDTYGVAEIKIV